MINIGTLLKGIIIKIICLTFSFFIVVSMIMPFNVVRAETPDTAKWYTARDFVETGIITINNPAGSYYTYYVKADDPDVRIINLCIKRSSNYEYETFFVAVKKGSFASNMSYRIDFYNSYNGQTSTPWTGTYSYQGTYVVNGETYYMRSYYGVDCGTTSTVDSLTSQYGYVIVPGAHDRFNSSTLRQYAYDYTFGQYAEEYEEILPFNHGALNVGFYTRFGITGTDPNNTTFKENVDVITWNNVDSNGNSLNNLGITVNIRAVPITWKSNQESVLNTLGLSDAVSDINSAAYFNNINFNNNEYSLRWGDVIQAFKNVYPSWSYVRYFDDGFWYKNGWYYQIQYYDSGLLTDGQPYTSDWQTITTTTSVSVADAETVEHNYTYQIDYGLDPSLFNTIQNVNNDNSTTNNWYIDQLVINTEPSPQDSENWFSTLLQTIVEALKEIINGILGIGGKLLDEIFKLIEAVGVNVVDFFTSIWNDLLDLINNIDLTLFEWYPDDEATESYNFVQPIIDAFIDTGLIYMLMIPFIVLVVRVFL